MITFDHLTKKYGNFTAVNDLSFEVSPEQSVALWGPNGAGKTTVIKCLLGLLRYDGTISIDGLDAQRDGRKARRLVGYVPQELSFYGDMRTLETAQFYAALKRLPTDQAAAVLGQVGLEDHAAKPVDALSGGMKQRLALGPGAAGRSACADPRRAHVQPGQGRPRPVLAASGRGEGRRQDVALHLASSGGDRDCWPIR